MVAIREMLTPSPADPGRSAQPVAGRAPSHGGVQADRCRRRRHRRPPNVDGVVTVAGLAVGVGVNPAPAPASTTSPWPWPADLPSSRGPRRRRPRARRGPGAGVPTLRRARRRRRANSSRVAVAWEKGPSPPGESTSSTSAAAARLTRVAELLFDVLQHRGLRRRGHAQPIERLFLLGQTGAPGLVQRLDLPQARLGQQVGGPAVGVGDHRFAVSDGRGAPSGSARSRWPRSGRGGRAARPGRPRACVERGPQRGTLTLDLLEVAGHLGRVPPPPHPTEGWQRRGAVGTCFVGVLVATRLSSCPPIAALLIAQVAVPAPSPMRRRVDRRARPRPPTVFHRTGTAPCCRGLPAHEDLPLLGRLEAVHVVVLAHLAHRRRRRSGEYRWPGNRMASSGTSASFWVRLSYSAAGSPPGRSVRPQPSRNSVSPATRRPSTRKHWLPGVWPGVWISSIGISPTITVSPPSCCDEIGRRRTPVTRCTHGASSRLHVDRHRRRAPAARRRPRSVAHHVAADVVRVVVGGEGAGEPHAVGVEHVEDARRCRRRGRRPRPRRSRGRRRGRRS